MSGLKRSSVLLLLLLYISTTDGANNPPIRVTSSITSPIQTANPIRENGFATPRNSLTMTPMTSAFESDDLNLKSKKMSADELKNVKDGLDELEAKRRVSSESASPLTLSSIYNYINKKQPLKFAQTLKQPQASSLIRLPRYQKQFSVESVRPQNQNQNHHNLYADNQQSIALGLNEPEHVTGKYSIRPEPQLDESDFTGPMLFATGNSIIGHNIVESDATKGQMFSKAILPDQAHDKRHLSSIYSNNMENANLIELPHSLVSSSQVDNFHHPTINANHDSYAIVHSDKPREAGVTSNHVLNNFYPEPQRQHNQHHPTHHQQHQSLRRQPQLVTVNGQQKHSASQTSKRGISLPTDAWTPPKHSKLLETKVVPVKKKETMLTNAQLMTLIDEMKDFNSRQSKPLEGGSQWKSARLKKNQVDGFKPVNHVKSYSPRSSDSKVAQSSSKLAKKFTNNNQDKLEKGIAENPENDEQRSQEEELPEDEPTTNAVEQTKPQRAKSSMSPEELAEFAKFLMSKDGANLRFQLGLEKDAPDDGDDDDYKDALLESKKKSTKTKAKKGVRNELESLDQRHKEAALQMDKYLDEAKARAKQVEKSMIKKKSGSDKEKLSDDEKKARKRRDHSVITHNRSVTKEVMTKIPAPAASESRKKPKESNAEKPDDTNFAKMLIKQEILEDQKELLQDPPTYDSEQKDDSNHAPQTRGELQNKRTKTSTPDDTFTASSLAAAQTGISDEDYEYPKKSDMSEELKKARDVKSKTRSRIGIPLDDTLKRALDGDMAIKAERQADGKLLLREGDQGPIMSMNMPKKSSNKEVIVEVGGDDGLQDSEPVPAQAEPKQDKGAQVLDSVKIRSSKPLEDEYPISEKVSDRLNKLSSNLDRYFNDGFMQEVESKAKLGEDENVKTPSRNLDSHQPQSSNAIEAAKIADEIQKGSSGETTLKGPKEPAFKEKTAHQEDNDFDVDVSIDGKRDNDRDEEEAEKSYDRERDEVKENDDDDKPIKRSGSPSTTRNKRRRKINKSKKEIRPSPSGPSKSVGRKKNRTPGLSEDKQVSRDETITSEKVEFENHGRLLPKLDPVESEAMETPIGPDGDQTPADLASSTKTKSSSGTNVSTSYGKKPSGKFFEESEW